jgi:hypothetical protein
MGEVRTGLLMSRGRLQTGLAELSAGLSGTRLGNADYAHTAISTAGPALRLLGPFGKQLAQLAAELVELGRGHLHAR